LGPMANTGVALGHEHSAAQRSSVRRPGLRFVLVVRWQPRGGMV
jgi:hypothetical protein